MIRLFFLFFVFFSVTLYSSDENADKTTEKELRILYFNVRNYFVENETDNKSEESRDAVARLIANAKPDIVVLAEMGTEKALLDLQKRLEKLNLKISFSFLGQGYDKTRHLALLAQKTPKESKAINHLFYYLRPQKGGDNERLYLQRGILYSCFQINSNYKIHILGIHLKSRLPNPRYWQGDMRRYEARQVRYFINKLLQDDPQANIILVGDLNDLFNSSPLRELREGRGAFQPLYDLRPLDERHHGWTHWYEPEDNYSRIDYGLASQNLLPEIIESKMMILHEKKQLSEASDHRALLFVISPREGQNWDSEKIEKKYPNQVRDFNPAQLSDPEVLQYQSDRSAQ